MKAQVVFLFAAVAALTAGATHIANPVHERESNRTSHERYPEIIGERFIRSIIGNWFGSSTPAYTCDFLPNISFYPEGGSPLPVYRCVLDSSEVLIATSSFHSATNPADFVTRATIVLNQDVLGTVYPGTFRATEQVLFRSVQSSDTSFSNPVRVKGLLILSTPNLKTGLLNYFNSEKYRCQFLPYVNFYTEQFGQLPAYKCIHGNNEVLISTSSFRTYNPDEYLHNVDITLSDAVINTYYPGSFIQVIKNQYRTVTGLEFAGTSVAINGLLSLTQY